MSLGLLHQSTSLHEHRLICESVHPCISNCLSLLVTKVTPTNHARLSGFTNVNTLLQPISGLEAKFAFKVAQ
jgi:hypothetical protein